MSKTKIRLISAAVAVAVLITALLFVMPAFTVKAASWTDDDYVASDFAGGSGTSIDPYKISTPAQLALLAKNVNSGTAYSGKYIKLTTDIDLTAVDSEGSRVQWTPIGTDSNQFEGTFDGNGKIVSGIYINTTSQDQGLFGYTSNAAIKNVGVADSDISGGNYVGGVCGRNNYSDISNCYNTGKISGKDNVGGICGYNSGTIQNCYNSGAVTGEDNVGGICGNNSGTIQNCYNAGTVSGNNKVGGICGLFPGGTIQNCYNAGTVSGNKYVGGVYGQVLWDSQVVTNCYNTGTVNGNGYVGGVGGRVGDNTTMTSCYYLEGTATGGINGADASGSAEVKTAADFKNLSTFSGWSTSTWSIDNILGRPVLTAVSEPYFSGSGTEADPYLIPDLTKLEVLRNYVNAGNGDGEYFRQTADIDMSEKYGAGKASWTPIGIDSIYFNGNYDGGGYVIKNIYIDGAGDLGLFGNVNSGTITNIGIEGGSIKGSGDCVGGVCGYLSSGEITNCFNTSTVSGRYDVGGVCGNINISTISNCYNTGAVTGTNGVGGVCGEKYSGTISNCYNAGKVTATDTELEHYKGGVCGGNSGGTITNCYYLTGTATGGVNSADVSGVAEVKTAAELCALDLGAGWTAGTYTAGTANGNFRTDSYVLPTLSVFSGAAPAGTVDVYNFGIGDAEDWQEYTAISTADELVALANDTSKWGGNYVLTDNIDMTGKAFTPIGNNTTKFTGKFSGDGKAVQNLTMDIDDDNVGLFGYLGENGLIMNVTVDGGNIIGLNYVGSVCGYNNGGTITGCYNTAYVKGSGYVGGICGNNDGGKISICSNSGVIDGNYVNYFGGICGNNSGGSVENCFNKGNITAGGTFVGGICGNIENSGTVAYCINGAFVNGGGVVGGVCGYKYSGIVTNCYYDKDFCKYGGIYDADADGSAVGLTTIMLANSVPTGFSTDIWADGSNNITINGRCAGGTYTLPALKGVGAAQTGTLDMYNFGIDGADDWQTYTPVTTASELQAIKNDLSGNYVLMNDIDMSGIDFTPIGYTADPFTGKFSGDGHTISNLTIFMVYDTNVQTHSEAAMFGNSTGTIMLVDVSGTVSASGYDNVAGICGYNNGGTIYGCSFAGSANGKNNIGGICGQNRGGEIKCCYSTAELSGTGTGTGGICGCISNDGTISMCYSAGKVSGNTNVGGVCGEYISGDITYCYYNNELFTDDNSYGTGLSTIEMTCSDALTNMAGFDTDVWSRKDVDKTNKTAYYPYLDIFANAPSVKYTQELDMKVSDGCTPTYGEPLKFNVSALIKFNGMDDYASDTNNKKGSFTVTYNNSNIVDSTPIADNTGLLNVSALPIDAVGDNIVTLVYSGTGSEYLSDGTKELTIDLAKRTTAETPLTESYTWGVSGEQSIDISEYLPNDEDMVGTAVMSDISGDSGILTGTPSCSDGMLTYTLNSHTGKFTGTATFSFTVETATYKDIKFNVTINIIDKAAQTNTPNCNMTFEVDNNNKYTVTIEAVDGAEYKFDNGEWGTSNTLPNVDHAKTVTGYIRYKETEEYYCGDEAHTASDSVTTGHGTLEYHDAVAPTCEDDGNIEYWGCSECEGVYFADEDGTTSLNSIVDPATGHSLAKTDGVEATCTENGNIDYWTCSKCGKIFSDDAGTTEITLADTVITATGHSLAKTDGVEATCTEDGNIDYWTCSKCGKIFSDDAGTTEITLADTVITATGHSLSKTDRVEATCTENGNIDYWTCSKCGKIFSDDAGTTEITLADTVITATGHSLVKTDRVEATCTEDGNIDYWTCNNCHKIFSDDEGTTEITLADTVITATGHSLAKTDGVEATCTEDGNIDYWTCNNCHKIFSDEAGTTEITLADTVITATGHSLAKTDGVEATCTEDGNIDYWTCNNCHKIYSDEAGTTEITLADTVIESTGHSYGAPTFNWSDDYSACTATFICANDSTHIETPDCEVTSNSTEATCEVGGTVEYTATVNFNGRNYSDVQTVNVAATGHTEVIDPAVPATCTETGLTEGKHCSVCSKVIVAQEEIIALGHSFTNYVSNDDADCVNDGTKTAVCDNGCGERDTIADVDSATGHNWDINYIYDANYHWHKCLNANCPLTADSEKDGYGAHISSGPATEDEAETCTICGYVINPALGHVHTNNLTYVAEVPATCTTDGVKAHYECRCGKLFEDEFALSEVTTAELIISAHHIWSEDWSSDNDINHYHLCTICGEKNDVTEHTFGEATVTIAPTEDTEGQKESTCTECGHVKLETIPKLGHTHVPSDGYTNDAEGHWRTCTECSDKLDYAPHTFDRGVITKNPTTLSSGVKTYTCTVCNYTKTESIPAKSGDSGYIPPISNVNNDNNKPNENEPKIKGDNGKTGWDSIADEIEKVKEGGRVNVDMNGTTTLPKDIVSDIKGKDIDLILDMGGGITWTINGKDVTDPKTVDLGVNVNANTIPVEIINNVTGEKYSIQISLAHNGEFGFTAILTVDLGSKNNGLYANLFYYNSKSKELEFMDYDKISQGKAELEFSHASDWAIIIDKEPLGGFEDIASDAGVTAEYDSIDMAENKYTFIIPVFAIAALAAAAAVGRKIKK